MEIVIAVVWAVTLVGAFAGGAVTGYNTAPRTNMIVQHVESKTDVRTESRTEANQNTITLNCTFIDGRKAEILVIKLEGLTNIKVNRLESNSNWIRTNIE